MLTKVASELHRGNVDTLGPAFPVAGGRRGQGILQRAHRLAQLRAVSPQLLQEVLVWCCRVRFHRPLRARIAFSSPVSRGTVINSRNHSAPARRVAALVLLVDGDGDVLDQTR